MEFRDEVFNREKFINAIDMLLDRSDSTKQTKARKYFQSLQQKHIEDHVFSIDSLVFDSFISLMNDPAVLMEDAWVEKIRKQLLGQLPFARTIAIKHNFVESLQSDELQVVNYLKEFCRVYTNLATNPELENEQKTLPEEYKRIRHFLYKFCINGRWVINSISSYLILQAAHILSTLPYFPVPSFGVMDDKAKLGYIFEVDETISTNDMIVCVQDLLQKLEGSLVIFVDIHMLSGGFMVNIR